METSRAETGSSQTTNSGSEYQRAGHAYALAAAAVELVRVGVREALGEADGVHHPGDALVHLFAVAADLVYQQRLGDELMHGHAAVEAGVGVLEYHLHLRADLVELAL